MCGRGMGRGGSETARTPKTYGVSRRSGHEHQIPQAVGRRDGGRARATRNSPLRTCDWPGGTRGRGTLFHRKWEATMCLKVGEGARKRRGGDGVNSQRQDWGGGGCLSPRPGRKARVGGTHMAFARLELAATISRGGGEWRRSKGGGLKERGVGGVARGSEGGGVCAGLGYGGELGVRTQQLGARSRCSR